MATAFTYKAAAHKFACGNDYTNLTVVNFEGPDGAKACAYSCNMNIDLDGEPQAYAPLSKAKLRPKDNLGNAGWKSDSQNAALKAQYESGKLALADLEKRREQLAASKGLPAGITSPGPAPAGPKPPGLKPPTDPALVVFDKQIAEKKRHLHAMSFEGIDDNGNPSKKNPKNFGKIFWKWYGVTALTPEDAQRASYLEMEAPTLTVRSPVLDTTSIYEDVFGRFPVVQSVFEPGTDYFVTPLPHAANKRYPSWDQRYFLPTEAFAQTPFGALAIPLGKDTGLHLNDMVFAVRLDTADTLSFPFRDTGFGLKVAECSFAAYGGLGGDYHPEKNGAAKFPNSFLNLYVGFPGKQTPELALAKFATASNASDFPVLLSFIAQATVDAKTKKSHKVTGDPIKAFEAWKSSPDAPKPQYYDVIAESLPNAGTGFIDRMVRAHAANSQGPFLRSPTAP
jgi:hypothetical protein